LTNALAKSWDQKEFFMTPWTLKLQERIAHLMRERGIWKEHGLNEAQIRRLIKVVPCVGNQSMDYDRGIDCTLIFHDPASFAAQEFPPTYAKARDALPEAVHWNPQKDTVVNIDVTANLVTKFSGIQRDRKVPRADFWVSKTGGETNHYLRNAVAHFPEEVGGKQHIRDAEARMTVIAARIINIFEIKSGRMGGNKLDHIYSHERDEQRKVEERLTGQKVETREQQQRNMDRNERDRRKKEERMTQSEAARSRKERNKRD